MLIYKATLQLPMHTLSYLCACKVICLCFFFAAFKVSIESSEAAGDFVTYKAKVEGTPLKKGKCVLN